MPSGCKCTGLYSIETIRGGLISVDPITLATSRLGVFAGGDIQTGPAIAIEAVAAGKRAANSIMRYFKGEELKQGRELGKVSLKGWKEIPLAEERRPRAKMPTISLERRQSSFNEVEVGFPEEIALKEASRCLDCGICSECLQCVNSLR